MNTGTQQFCNLTQFLSNIVIQESCSRLRQESIGLQLEGSISWGFLVDEHGGFHKWGTPKWMVHH